MPRDPYMRVHDAELGRAAAVELRLLADMIEAGEVKYVATFATLTVEGAKKRDYVFDHYHAFIETVGAGEYALVLGGLRDWYLGVEGELRRRGLTTIVEHNGEDDPTEDPEGA